jgi:DNA repair protein RecO (recombination protein O)
VLTALLDLLDGGSQAERATGAGWARKHLAQAGFAMLSAVGYGMELDRCVACGRPCPEGKPAFIDAARGGIVCRACGGGGQLMPATVRAAAKALIEGRVDAVTDAHAEALLKIVDRAMAAHAGFER